MALARPTLLLLLTDRLLQAPRRILLVRGPEEPLPVVRIPRALQRRQAQPRSGRQVLDYFSIERAQLDVPPLRHFSSQDSFADLGPVPGVLRELHDAAPEVVRPTTVQSRTIPPLLRDHHLLCAAETGSGKTLSYLLPLLQRILDRLVLDIHRVPAPRPCAFPRISGTVATPGALWKTLKSQLIGLEQQMVLDEAHTLLEESFLDLVDYILEKSHIAQDPADLEDPFNPEDQLVLVGATFREGVSQLLSKRGSPGSLTTITTSQLHCVMPHVRQTFLRLKGEEKVAQLLQILKQRDKEEKPAATGTVLVFCNSSSTVNWLGYILDDHKIKHLRLQGQMPASMRAGIFQCFQKGSQDILLCTDIASRGLDSTHVELVVNYDFPLTLQDYIHRAGSVGWLGSQVPGVVPPASPIPAYYHVLHQGCGETQVGWHGETYCLVGGYRLYGDAPLATPAKAKTDKPAEKPKERVRRALKKHHAPSAVEKALGCPSPKIRVLNQNDKRSMTQKLAG
ncbi:putative ATP-dependent RNA helicase DDX28 [Sciurus carolinensis]|uniref:ATP-dependent RNA helicase n=1 Tax=Sciurus carolinensis TaxID=30640 RepID=A0AA41TAH7_SCICA|nr:putative ATP-dependent RNA helicase DDX28 [Sciurus carolinensis]